MAFKRYHGSNVSRLDFDFPSFSGANEDGADLSVSGRCDTLYDAKRPLINVTVVAQQDDVSFFESSRRVVVVDILVELS